MNILKDYKSKLEVISEFKTKGYYRKSYTLKCNDTKEEQTHIHFSIYYAHCNYKLYVEGIKIKYGENGFVQSFTDNKCLHFEMPYTSYRFSKKQFENVENFLKTNIFNLLETYCEINKNINVE